MINAAQLKSFVESNSKLVQVKPSNLYPGLSVLKYRKVVFFKGLWNEYLEECRGTVVDSDFNPIVRPFTKIYNYGIEANSPVFNDDELLTAYRKVNGFMVSMTWYNNDILIATTGSTDSDFIQYVKDCMVLHSSMDNWKQVIKSFNGNTILFECVHQDDPHIVVEKLGLYVIGIRENSWDAVFNLYGLDNSSILFNIATQLNCHFVTGFVVKIKELLAITKTVQHEGFVFYSKGGKAAKIKSKYYLIQKMIARKKELTTLNKQLVDEEYYPLIEYLKSIKSSFYEMNEQDRLSTMRNFLNSQ